MRRVSGKEVALVNVGPAHGADQLAVIKSPRNRMVAGDAAGEPPQRMRQRMDQVSGFKSKYEP
jgi:hypothetical protein